MYLRNESVRSSFSFPAEEVFEPEVVWDAKFFGDSKDSSGPNTLGDPTSVGCIARLRSGYNIICTYT